MAATLDATDKTNRETFCSVVDCNKIATVGAHVRIIRGSQEFASIYVIPMCHGCNNRQGKSQSHHHVWLYIKTSYYWKQIFITYAVIDVDIIANTK